ncbi:MAG: 3'(2'),5'-bisphosphate nucleotidase CysQ [Magnetococcales bacterium]|nr:3'(2'),5'-bisphosphate nucleotidase CysQ [Magnetococcales bacterium]
MPANEALMNTIVAGVREAGAATLKYFQPGEMVSEAAGVRHKSPDNPLTEADLECDRILHQHLMGAYPDYGWLSEETTDDRSRMSRSRVWVVDPIDGTKDFIQGRKEYAISVGLVEDGLPVAACTLNPATGELFTALKGGGAFLNGKAIKTSDRTQFDGATCLASRSELGRGEWEQFHGLLKPSPMGSVAYKLALVAAGRYDMTFTLTPKSEWDICSGVLLVQEAGGRITNKEGEPFRFNKDLEYPKTRSVLTSNGPLHDELLARLKDIPLSPDRYMPKGSIHNP